MENTTNSEASEKVTHLTQELVSINSEPVHTEYKVEQFLGKILQEMGFYLERAPYEKNRNNIIAIYPHPDRTPIDRYIAFSGHMDTVPGYKKEDGYIKNGKIYGRGSCDMKGGISAFITAVQEFMKEYDLLNTKLHKKLQRGIVIFLTVDEETGCAGIVGLTKKETKLSQKLNQDYYIDFGINAEPTDCSPIISHKGVVWFELDFYGESAHASVPHLGRNAIELAAQFIVELKTLQNILKSRNYFSNSDITPPTLNVGLISGGTKTNVIPDHVHLEIDRRIIPGETADSALEEIRRIARKFPDERIEINMSHPGHAYQIPLGKENEFFKEISKIAEKYGTLGTSFMEGYTESDIYYRYFGIPMINLGPGSIKQAHTENEYVEIIQLAKATQIYYEILKKYCLK
jgi:acetylornithine deacetylase/succinyl-diaminopimelate desuccinylase-like protein